MNVSTNSPSRDTLGTPLKTNLDDKLFQRRFSTGSDTTATSRSVSEEASYQTISDFYVEACGLSGFYSGGLKNGRYHGVGTMKYTKAPRAGQVYEGHWVDDLKCGQGSMKYVNGDLYEGEWFDDMRHGHGKLTSLNGTVYEGEWKCDTKDGLGTLTNCDGSRYEGEFANDKRHGRGVLLRKDGSRWYDESRNQWVNGAIV